jgi:uroporphyrinogen III methyltransferase/synthase
MKYILNTRAAHQAAELDALIRHYGAHPVPYPCIAIAPPADPAALDAALDDLCAGVYGWLIVTSVNTVMAMAERLARHGRSLAGVPLQVAAVGEVTAQAVDRLLGRSVALIPDDYSAAALAARLPIQAGERVLLPQSAIAAPTLAEQLRARGAVVNGITAYRTVRGQGGVRLLDELRAGRVDAVTFTSSSTVTYLLERLADEGGTLANLSTVTIACIGANTAATARDAGLRVDVVPPTQSLDHMMQALMGHWQQAQ